MATVTTRMMPVVPQPFAPITVVLEDAEEAGALTRLLGETNGRILYGLFSDLDDAMTEQDIRPFSENYDLWGDKFDCRKEAL